MQNHCPFDRNLIVFRSKVDRLDRVWPKLLSSGFVINPSEKLWVGYEIVRNAFISAELGGLDVDKPALLMKAKETCLAHFKLNTSKFEVAEFEIDGHNYESKTQNGKYQVGIGSWLEAWSLAVISRDDIAIATLCQFGKEDLQRDGMGCNAFDEALLAMIKGMYDPSVDMKALIIDVMEKSDPQYIQADHQNFTYQLLLPFANVLTTVMSKAAERKFQEGMAKALVAHQKFWSLKEFESLPRGWISLPLSAAMVLAKDHRNYNLSEDSTYLLRVS